jgi:DNA-binding transcriptional MerR regulator
MTACELVFRTAEVARIAEVSLRQLQIWEEKRVAVASRHGRVRIYDATQALFVVVCAELRRRGLSFQRLKRVAAELRRILVDHRLAEIAGHRHVFLLTDGRRVHFADSPNKTCELVSNLFRPCICVNVSDCLQRIQNAAFMEDRCGSCSRIHAPSK